jgi:hypothetical protein
MDNLNTYPKLMKMVLPYAWLETITKDRIYIVIQKAGDYVIILNDIGNKEGLFIQRLENV